MTYQITNDCDSILNRLYQDYKLYAYHMNDYNITESHYLDTTNICHNETINTYQYYYSVYSMFTLHILLYYFFIMGSLSYVSIRYLSKCEQNRRECCSDGSGDSSGGSSGDSSDTNPLNTNHYFDYYPLTVLLRQFSKEYQQEIFHYLNTKNGFNTILEYFIFEQNSTFNDENGSIVKTKEAYNDIKMCFNETYFNHNNEGFTYIPITNTVKETPTTYTTTFGHLNFIHWLYYSGIYQYVLEHLTELIDEMKKNEIIDNDTAIRYRENAMYPCSTPKRNSAFL